MLSSPCLVCYAVCRQFQLSTCVAREVSLKPTCLQVTVIVSTRHTTMGSCGCSSIDSFQFVAAILLHRLGSSTS